MTDEQLQRYARHILLDDVGLDGQQRLLQSRVLLVGAGGLGCAAGLYLAASGVGHLTLVDPDGVDATNLQRQIGHTLARLGQPKVESLAEAIRQINPDPVLECRAQAADAALLADCLPTTDLVVDCTDNFATRQLLNAACVAHRVPLVSGAAIRFDGQLTVIDPRQPHSPCYACLHPPEQAPTEAECRSLGVFAPLVGILGSLQAAEALKLLMGLGEPMVGRLWLLDGRDHRVSEMRFRRRTHCPVCALGPAAGPTPRTPVAPGAG